MVPTGLFEDTDVIFIESCRPVEDSLFGRLGVSLPDRHVPSPQPPTGYPTLPDPTC